MSAPVVIRIENVSKRYRISHLAGQATLRDAMHHGLRLVWRRLRWKTRLAREEFWALREVSFEVKRGEVVGIIGRNGAGKSTLLKILSRITEPSSGRVTLRGRVASLLEVGTGFHPELTGRDNVFLNGAILGMTQAEVRKKFDEIVAFAEVERFLDTPVKHYSSGMYVRLAFAVAAHLEPDILIVDEVLAVGDTAFQKKCLGRMEMVSRREGRTVLFVSHNTDAVMQLCTSALLLESGRMTARGVTEVIVGEYLTRNMRQNGYRAPAEKRHGILRVTAQGATVDRSDLVFTIAFRTEQDLTRPTLGVVVYSLGGTPLFGSNTLFHPWSGPTGITSAGTAVVAFTNVPLWNGCYKVSAWLSDDRRSIDHVADAVTFEVTSQHLPLGAPSPKDIGAIHVRGEWLLIK